MKSFVNQINASIGQNVENWQQMENVPLHQFTFISKIYWKHCVLQNALTGPPLTGTHFSLSVKLHFSYWI